MPVHPFSPVGTLAVCRVAVVQSSRLPAFSFNGSPSASKNSRNGSGWRLRGSWWMTACLGEGTNWQNTSNAPVPSVTAIWESCFPNGAKTPSAISRCSEAQLIFTRLINPRCQSPSTETSARRSASCETKSPYHAQVALAEQYAALPLEDATFPSRMQCKGEQCRCDHRARCPTGRVLGRLQAPRRLEVLRKALLLRARTRRANGHPPRRALAPAYSMALSDCERG